MKTNVGHAIGQNGLFAEFEPDTANRNDDFVQSGNLTPRRLYPSRREGKAASGATRESRSDLITERFLILALERDPDQSDGWQFRASAKDHRAGSPLLTEAIRLVDQTN